MSTLATQRLIDAAARLDAAERALLNLWVNRGFDDLALARMTGMDAAAIASRRQRIVAHLSEALGLPADEIRGALTEIAASSAAELGPAGTSSNGTAEPASGPAVREVDPSANGRAPEAPSPGESAAGGPAPAPGGPAPTAGGPAPAPGDPALEASAEPAAPTTTQTKQRPRRGLWVALGLLGAVVAAVVLLVALSPGPKRVSRSAARPSTPIPATPTPTAPVPTTPAPPVTPAPARRAPRVRRPSGAGLVSLPGGLSNARGSIRVLGKGATLRLELSVTGIPSVRGGHYEIWLYNSIVYSEPVGRLLSGATRRTFRLPRNAHRYRWIDISFQPTGFVNHSGESVLRAANPAAGRNTAPHRRSGRRHQRRRQRSRSSRARRSK